MKKIAAIQMSSSESVSKNLETVERLARVAASNQAKLLVLPENVAFLGKNEEDKLPIAEDPVQGPIQNFFSKLAKELDIWLVAGTLPIKSPSVGEKRVYARSMVWDNKGQNVASYDKIHLFDVSVQSPSAAESVSATDSTAEGATKKPENATYQEYIESKTICPGKNIVSLNSPLGKLGLSVCYDLRFPELYRKLLSQGTEIILVPSAFTATTGEAHWESLLRARSIENFSYVVAANQVGVHANGRASWGHSMIVDPWGKILAMQTKGEGIIYAEIDLEYLADIRRRFPTLEHQRIF